MDPRTVYATLREGLDRYEREEYEMFEDEAAVGEFFDAVNNLDGWLRRGGFLPEEWKNAGKH